MAYYKLKISGWELNGSAHSLTNEEKDALIEYQDLMGIDDLSEIGFDLEDVIDGYYPFDTNMWTISKPLDISERTYFDVVDAEGNTVLEFKIDDIENIEDVDIVHEPDTPLRGFGLKGEEENILLFLEENKGLVCDFEFYSDELPKVSDFAYEPNVIETPDGDWDFVNKVFFRGDELNMEFNDQFVNGKALTVELWTLDDEY